MVSSRRYFAVGCGIVGWFVGYHSLYIHDVVGSSRQSLKETLEGSVSNKNGTDSVDGMVTASPETTILVTSNLIPSHPSISMINTTIHSCLKHLKGLHPDTPIVVAIDFPRHPYNEEDLQRFDRYIRVLVTEFGPRVALRIASQNQGLSWSVFHTLKYINTEFVYVIQHDMPFTRPIQHDNLVRTMRDYPQEVRIIRFPLQPIPQTGNINIEPCFGKERLQITTRTA